MKQYGLNRLREMFLSFFEEKDHLRLPGFSLVPRNDASLLLINSGMAPMKTWFTGEQIPPRKRVCTCQKCIRTTDIDSVGKTSRHGSYFEMLGNFSFGDYFKHDAIAWCWEFLTKRLGLDENRLYPSVYTDDNQAFDIWRDVAGIAPGRITRLGKEDNFWDHGSGPCGPCSEVYYDRGQSYGCGSSGCAPGCGCDRYVEVWNNVFTQYNNDGSGNYTELAQKNIDTGLGLERLACVCQGVESIFEVDTIKNIVLCVSQLCGRKYGEDINSDVSIRIITDHTRAAVMMICDGILPSNERRGYVLRRLLRRAARHGRLLGINDIFLSNVCDAVIAQNADAYPEVSERGDFIKSVVRTEEEAFGKTIDAGMSMLGAFTSKLAASGGSILPGSDAFKLYDTFGFPLDLTIDILAEQDMTVDEDGFVLMMEEQRSRARKAREALGDLAWERIDLGPDNSPTIFTGYENNKENAAVMALVSGGEVCSALFEGDEGYIVLGKTPFYAEKGGQSADTGTICTGDACFEVTDVQQNKADKILHHGKMTKGTISTGDTVQACIDTERRAAIKRSHSVTHLLHSALKNILGEHVNQAGSLVEPDKIRFDFTHIKALNDDELSAIERQVNDAILKNHCITVKEMPVDEAKKLGAAALFGEKYGDIVRVVTMGESVELCGGTHLECTAQAGMFTILSEFSVAAGVRRIEATTGWATYDELKASRALLHNAAALLKAGSFEEITVKIEQNTAALRELRAKLESTQTKEIDAGAKQLLKTAEKNGKYNVIAAKTENGDTQSLKQTADILRSEDADVIAVLGLVKDGKLTLMATCGKNAVSGGIKAGDIIRELAKICSGSGGGKPDFAMGGGKDASKLDEALAYAKEYVQKIQIP